MIQLHLMSKDRKMLMELGKLLLQKNLAIDVTLQSESERLELKEGELKNTAITRLTAKTKSLLFNQIETLFKEQLLSGKLEMFSVAIVHMNWEEAKRLSKEVEPV